MPYLHVQDFKGGLDVRRSQEASPSGTLFEALNVHISRGGEVEKRRAMVPLFTLPAGTLGLASTAYALYTFGVGTRPAALDASILYQNLAITSGSALVRVLDWDVFNGKIYVTAQYADGTLAHFYNGARVTDWTAPAGTVPAYGADVRYLPVMTLAGKEYAGAANLLFYSAIDDPTKYTASTPNLGQGYIDMSNSFGGAERIIGLSNYQGRIAVFSRRAVQIWEVDPDPAKYRLQQVLTNLGTRSSRTILNFGDTDVFFLADNGVRSLRARDSSNNAATSDIGTPVDPLIQAAAAAQFANGAYGHACIEPNTGRYWLALGRSVYVFSFFQSSKVSAWSRYEFNFAPTDFAALDNKLYARGDDGMLYIYGGTSGENYGSDYECVVELSLLDAGKPATMKTVHGLDLACVGEWAVRFGTDPANPDTRELVATVDRTTYGFERIGMQGYGTHFSYELRHQGEGRAAIFGLVTHFKMAEQD